MIRNYGQRVGRLLAGVGLLMLSAVSAFGEQPPAATVLGGDLLPDGPPSRVFGPQLGLEGIIQMPVVEPRRQLHLLDVPEGIPTAAPTRLSDYWLGIVFHYPAEVRGALRTQLGLPEGQGLLVDLIAPDGPAAGADINEHDILLKADGKPLGTLQDLVDAVDAAKDKEMTLELLRAGKPKEIRVTPVKRAEKVRQMLRRPNPGDPLFGRIYEFFERERPGSEGRPPWRFHSFSLGAILPPGAPAGVLLPGNLSISINKQGGKPVRIEIRRGDERWEVDENGLEQLPADVRVHVQRMLDGVSVSVDVPGRVMPEAHVEGPLRDFAWPRFPNVQPEGRLEKRLEEMNRRIDELRKTIEQVREKRPKVKTPEKKATEAKPQSI